jgi:Fe-S-cluster containining protein
MQSDSACATQDAPRDCGGCNVCCTAMKVAALDKPAGLTCAHQTPTGCGIYLERPQTCRSWFCMWVRDDKDIFTDAQRPDRLGPVLHRQLARPHHPPTGRLRPRNRPDSAMRPQAIEAIEYLRQFVPVQIVEFGYIPATPLTINGEAA